MEQEEWERLSPEEKRVQLYLNQKQTLEAFLERGAISKAQFDKSLQQQLQWSYRCTTIQVRNAWLDTG